MVREVWISWIVGFAPLDGKATALDCMILDAPFRIWNPLGAEERRLKLSAAYDSRFVYF